MRLDGYSILLRSLEQRNANYFVVAMGSPCSSTPLGVGNCRNIADGFFGFGFLGPRLRMTAANSDWDSWSAWQPSHSWHQLYLCEALLSAVC